MDILIIEDEQLAAERMKELLLQFDSTITVLAILDSIKASVQWLNENKHPELIFMDIQLADGLSFEVFEQVKIDCPVIFTTAYEEYAIKAFKVNSIDYLLKPIDGDELRSAIEKFQDQYYSKRDIPLINSELIESVKQMLGKEHKRRFIVKVGEHIRSVDVDEILFFYSLGKATFLRTSDNKSYDVHYSLDAISEKVDPQQFFRANRKYIISHKAIVDIVPYSSSRLKITLKNPEDESIFISREKMQIFKSWLDS